MGKEVAPFLAYGWVCVLTNLFGYTQEYELDSSGSFLPKNPQIVHIYIRWRRILLLYKQSSLYEMTGLY